MESVVEVQEHSAKVETFEINHAGDLKPFKYIADERVETVIVDAIRRFQLAAQPHQLGLFKAGQTNPLESSKTLREADVRPGEVLILRPIVVQGG